jgi:hypothetical protein
MRLDGWGELMDAVMPAAAGGLFEAKGLENGLSKRLVSELQPATLKPITAEKRTEGGKHARGNLTVIGMVYPLIIIRNRYD